MTILCAALFPQPIYALEATLGGTFRVFYYSSDRELDDKEHFPGLSLQPKLTATLLPQVSLYTEARIIEQKPWKEIDASLREGYLDAYVASADLRLGKQIIRWGRADTINPTDNLTPSDYTLLFPEDDDLRTGVHSFKVKYALGDFNLSGIWIPFFEPNKIPLPIPRSQIMEEKPADGLGNSQYGFKLDKTGEQLDWSLSYYDGYDLMPDLDLKQSVTLNYQRIKVIGGDFASSLGKFGLRGEGAYIFTEDRGGRDPLKKNPYFFYVLGIDKTYNDKLYMNLQFIERIVSRFQDPHDIQDPIIRDVAVTGATINNQLDRITNSASFKVGWKMLNETLNLEVSSIYNFTRGDYLVRPRVFYAIDDHYSVITGGDIYKGPKESFFGLLEKNSTFFIELRYGFSLPFHT